MDEVKTQGQEEKATINGTGDEVDNERIAGKQVDEPNRANEVYVDEVDRVDEVEVNEVNIVDEL